jgi:hypothetical protein
MRSRRGLLRGHGRHASPATAKVRSKTNHPEEETNDPLIAELRNRSPTRWSSSFFVFIATPVAPVVGRDHF